LVDIGFPFEFYGASYDKLRASVYGFLSFGETETVRGLVGNEQNNGGANQAMLAPALYPLWDFHQPRDIGPRLPAAVASASVSGETGARVFTYESRGIPWNFGVSGPVVDYQARLYEGSNIIEYIYHVGESYAAPLDAHASIGLGADGDRYLSLSNSGVSPRVEREEFVSDIATRPASGQLYRFAPVFEAVILPGETGATLTLLADDEVAVNGGSRDGRAFATPPRGYTVAPESVVVTVKDADNIPLTAELAPQTIAEGAQTTLTVRAPVALQETAVVTVDLSGPVAASASAAGYRFETGRGAYEPLETAARLLEQPSGARLTPVDIGFDFEFYGKTYDALRASVYGFLSFGETETVRGLAGDPQNNNAANQAAFAPAIYPLWDFHQPTDVGPLFPTAVAGASVSGETGARVFTYEARGIPWNFGVMAPVVDYQARLYEGSNIIEYIYHVGESYAAPLDAHASIGLGASGERFLSLSDSGVSPSVERYEFVNDIATRPASGQVYRFVPAYEAIIPRGGTDGALTLTGEHYDAPNTLSRPANLELAALTDGYAVAPSALTLTVANDVELLAATLSSDTLAEGETARLELRRADGAKTPETIAVKVTLTGDYSELRKLDAGFNAISDYSFDYGAEAGLVNYVSLDNAGIPAATLAYGDLNDGAYEPFDIGFGFNFYGETYTQIRASTNGLLSFQGRAVLSDAELAGAKFNGRQALRDLPLAPALFPLWDDIEFSPSGPGVNRARAGVYGPPGARVFIFETLFVQWSAVELAYQVRLYEGSNRVEYRYALEGDGERSFSPGATFGLARSADDFVTLGHRGRARLGFFESDGFVTNIRISPAGPLFPERFVFTPLGELEIDAPIGAGETFAAIDLTASDDDYNLTGRQAATVAAALAPQSSDYAFETAARGLALTLTDADPTLLVARFIPEVRLETEDNYFELDAPSAVAAGPNGLPARHLLTFSSRSQDLTRLSSVVFNNGRINAISDIVGTDNDNIGFARFTREFVNAPDGYAVLPRTATLTIIDDETALVAALSDAAARAGETIALDIWVADDVDRARRDGEMRPAILTLRFAFFCIEDEIEMRFNGRVLSLVEAEISDERALTIPLQLAGNMAVQAPLGFSAHWFRFRLAPEEVRRGANRVEIAVKKLEVRAGFARSINGAEILVRYKDFVRPEGLVLERIAPPGG